MSFTRLNIKGCLRKRLFVETCKLATIGVRDNATVSAGVFGYLCRDAALTLALVRNNKNKIKLNPHWKRIMLDWKRSVAFFTLHQDDI